VLHEPVPDGFLCLAFSRRAFGLAPTSAGLLSSATRKLARPAEVQVAEMPCSIAKEPQPQICLAARGRDAKAPSVSCHSKTNPPNRTMRSRLPIRHRDVTLVGWSHGVGSLASTTAPCCRATGPLPVEAQPTRAAFPLQSLSHEHALPHTMGVELPRSGNGVRQRTFSGAPTQRHSFRCHPVTPPAPGRPVFRPERRRLVHSTR